MSSGTPAVLTRACRCRKSKEIQRIIVQIFIVLLFRLAPWSMLLSDCWWHALGFLVAFFSNFVWWQIQSFQVTSLSWEEKFLSSEGPLVFVWSGYHLQVLCCCSLFTTSYSVASHFLHPSTSLAVKNFTPASHILTVLVNTQPANIRPLY